MVVCIFLIEIKMLLHLIRHIKKSLTTWIWYVTRRICSITTHQPIDTTVRTHTPSLPMSIRLVRLNDEESPEVTTKRLTSRDRLVLPTTSLNRYSHTHTRQRFDWLVMWRAIERCFPFTFFCFSFGVWILFSIFYRSIRTDMGLYTENTDIWGSRWR